MTSDTLIKIDNVRKTYAGKFEALKGVNLEINRGEILALLGPNGAGKTTLINAICGVVVPTSGSITVDGFDVIKDFRKTRSMIGLVPQELQLEAFEKVFQNDDSGYLLFINFIKSIILFISIYIFRIVRIYSI